VTTDYDYAKEAAVNFCLVTTVSPIDCFAGVLRPDGYYWLIDGSLLTFDQLIRYYSGPTSHVEFYSFEGLIDGRQIFLTELNRTDMRQLLQQTLVVAALYEAALKQPSQSLAGLLHQVEQAHDQKNKG
jgi:hypothetical protein